MSISALSANGYWDHNPPSSLEKIEQEFQQLGSDLQSGNLTAAQADFVTLQQDLPQTSNSSSQTSSPTSNSTSNSTSNPIEQAFSQLSQDLQAGNLTAAQQDYQTIQQDFQNQATHWSQSAQGTQGAWGHRHHHEGASESSSKSSQVSQLMSQLGQELQSGDLTSAQQTFASFQGLLGQSLFGQSNQNGGQQPSTASESTSSTISVSA